MENNIMAVVLAAGKGTRLRTEGIDLPKVMRTACGKPLLHYVLEAISFVGKENTVIVVGYRKEKVTAAFDGYRFTEQKEQLGTGHAVMSARDELSGFDGDVLVCYGDMPLLRRETYEALCAVHRNEKNACTLLSGTTDEDLPYGRVLRDASGAFAGVVEDRDCTPEQKKINELNIGVYVFSTPKLLKALERIGNDNAQGEYYLTDVPAVLLNDGEKIGVCKRELGRELIGVNTVEQLETVEEELSKERR